MVVHLLIEVDFQTVLYHLQKRIEVYFPLCIFRCTPAEVDNVRKIAVIAINQVVKQRVVVDKFAVSTGIDIGRFIMFVAALLLVLMTSTLLRIVVLSALLGTSIWVGVQRRILWKSYRLEN